MMKPEDVDAGQQFLNWITTMTPDKLAIVFPLFVGYAIIRSRQIETHWCWLVCPVLGAFLFTVLGSLDQSRTLFQNLVFNFSIGALLGIVAALFALGVHSGVLKPLAKIFPVLNFLVLLEDPQPQPPVDPAKPKD